MKKRVIVTGDFSIPAIENDLFEIIHLREFDSYVDIEREIQSAWGYILGGPEFLSEELLAKSTLKKIVVMGTGTSSFLDVPAANSKKIEIFNTPNLNADSVAEFAVSVIISSLSNIFHSVEGVHSGSHWYQKQRKSLKNARVGIVGMGNIGQYLVYKLKALGAQNIYYTNRTDKKISGVKYVSLKELAQKCDVISIHLTFCLETENLFNEEIFNNSNPELNLLNFSNPKIVNRVDLNTALRLEKIKFSFLDGFYEEWIENQGSQAHREDLLSLPTNRFIASSHIAAQEEEVVSNIFDTALSILCEESNG